MEAGHFANTFKGAEGSRACLGAIPKRAALGAIVIPLVQAKLQIPCEVPLHKPKIHHHPALGWEGEGMTPLHVRLAGRHADHLEVVDQRPVEVAPHVIAIIDQLLHLQRAPLVSVAPAMCACQSHSNPHLLITVTAHPHLAKAHHLVYE